MDKQQQAPILAPFFIGEGNKNINPIWQRWFQRLKTRDDEVKRRPYKTFTASESLTTWDLGKTILFDIGTSAVDCTLPSVGERDVWSWVTIFKRGTGDFQIIVADSGDYIENGASLATYGDPKRTSPNVTLQLVDEAQWAIIGATGIWRVQP